ncbi:unnamed protein product (macronuclear) [Paramecium tetraurelia]|uniref:Uncharacterized protein n=1 Tax=Paramecium tetraurelia TaxID=5888 RepID=A0DGB0_PARTE|nr:uncharacterized protein GSPATT00002206001 [Paramecium tetraurelia]CAK82077.1 unnamed protein product [Paramecium tetraurelia]|eukprot:XP_001449474.1 hypothetical protein (macronuclear) [Paramecium tetraurelia strain d4-2]
MNDHLQRIHNDTINSAYVSFAKRYKPRNASLAQQHDINNNPIQIQPSKKRVKPRYLTPTRNVQSFQDRVVALPVISSSPKSKYYVSNLFTPFDSKKQDPYFKDWNQKFEHLLCGTLRKFNLNQEQKLFNQSFTPEEQLQMIKVFKEKPPYQFTKKNKQRSSKNKDLDEDFAIHDISQYFYKLQD